MFCKYCGKEIPDEAAFCPACGRELGGSGTIGNADKAENAKPAEPKTAVKRRGWIVAIVIIVAAAVVALIAVFTLSDRGGSGESNTSVGSIVSQPELSDHNVEVAQEIIDAVDQYLNGEIMTATVAAREVQSLITQVELPDSSDDSYQLTLEARDCMYNIQIELENLKIVSGFADEIAGNDPVVGSRQQVMEYRGELAEIAGLN